jgi:hypothetical protein
MRVKVVAGQFVRSLLVIALLLTAFALTPRVARAAIINVPVGGSLQAAINVAQPNDVIRLFGNTQANETVNLALMGSAVGGGPGNLTIVGVNGASATLLGGNGSRIVYNSATPFPGTLTFDSVTFSTSASTTTPAVSLQNMGSVIFVNTLFDGVGAEGCASGVNGCTGLYISLSSGAPVIGIYSSTFRNIASDAINIDVQGTAQASIVVNVSLITDNGINPAATNTGVQVFTSGSATANLTVSQVSFSNLQGRAVWANAAGSSIVATSVVSNVISSMTDNNLGAITLSTEAAATSPRLNAIVADNQISSVAANGVLGRLQSTGPSTAMNLQILRNTITNVDPTNSSRRGVLVEALPTSTANGVRGSLNARIEGNQIEETGGSGIQLRIDDVNAAASIRNNRLANNNRIPNSSDGAIAAFVGGNNSDSEAFDLNTAIIGNTIGSSGVFLQAPNGASPIRVESTFTPVTDYIQFNNTFNTGGTARSSGTLTSIPLNSVTRPSENSPPGAFSDFFTVPNSTVSSLAVLADDRDVDLGDTVSLLSFQAVSARGGVINRNDNGTPANLADDQLTYTPLGTQTGLDRFYYVVRDIGGRLSINQVVLNLVADATAPDTTITVFPGNPSSDNTPTFQFTGSDNLTPPANLAFQCRLYLNTSTPPAFSTCTSPFTSAALPDGTYVFQVRAVDQVGNIDPTPAQYTWLIDATAPTTTFTAGPANPTNSTSASFTFNATDSSGISRYECSLDGAPFSTCVSPQNLSGLTEGSHTFRARAVDNAGNTETTPASYSWAVDLTAPNTTITGNPAALSNSANASFSFTGNDPTSNGVSAGVASFQCSLDGGAFAACTSPRSYTGLAEGSHTFAVRAVDAAGNIDGTPASYSWTVDTTSPPPPVVNTPANGSVTSNPLPAVTGTAEPNSTVTVFIDGSAVGATSADSAGNWSFTPSTPLSQGSHTVRARAADAAGNGSVDSNTNTFTVDSVDPDTAITGTPPNPAASASASFSFSGSGTGSAVVGFECSLDGAPFSTCASPQSYTGLAEGSHTFRVRALDAAGNRDSTPASFSWSIDLSAPDTTITARPAALSNSSSASFSFTGGDGAGSGVASFECSLDGGAFAACTSPRSYTGLADGSHTFAVRAVDVAGNIDGTPASYSWTVDTGAPDTVITANPSNPSASADALFSFSGSDGGTGVASLECALDGAAFAPCTSPASYTGLSNGAHSFQVRAVDGAGNIDPTPASFSWTIDTTAPTVDIVNVSPDPRATPVGSIVIEFSEPVSGFDLGDLALERDGVALDLTGASLSSAGNNYTLGNLSGLTAPQGSYTLTLTAFGSGIADQAGNALATGASDSWTVDTTPVLNSQAITVNEEGTATIALDATDPTGGSLSFTLLGGLDPAAGTLSGTAPNLSFTGATDFNGVSSFRYRACNAQSVCAEATVTITVAPVNDAPVVPSTPPSITVGEDTPITMSVVDDLGLSDAKDTAPPAAPGAVPFLPLQSITAVTSPASGALSDVRPADGTLVYTPNPNFNGSDTFTLQICDRGTPAGASACSDVVVSVTVTARNDAPSFTSGGNVNVAEDSGAYSATWATGINAGPADEAGQTVTFEVTANSRPGLFSVAPAIAPDGALSFTPAANANGSADITVVLKDNGGTAGGGQNSSAPVTFTITVTPVPDTPTATVTRSDPSPTSAATVRYLVSFTEDVSGVGLSDFSLGTTGVSAAALAGVTGGPRDYSVAVTTGATEGTITLNLLDDDTIVSFDGTPLGGTGASNGAVNGGAAQTYEVDTIAPDTTVTVGPANPAASSAASFSFTGSDGGSGPVSFECALDGAAFAACTSPASYTGLADGAHSFQVRAVDKVGNTDPTPASVSWVVDTTAPDTTITSGPPAITNSADAAFSFEGSDGGSGLASFECALDGAPFAACTSPASFTGLADGPHSFQVRAVDAAGNLDPSPASVSWTIDSAPLTVTVEQAPAQADPVGTAPVRFVVTFNKPVVDFVAADLTLGGTAPGALSALVSGSGATYTVAISGMTGGGTIVLLLPAGVATDSAGNLSQASTSVDNSVTFAPTLVVVTGIVRADASPTGAATVRFNVSFSEPVSGVDAADFRLAASGVSGASISGVTGSGASYVATVVTGTGDGAIGLNLRDDDSIVGVSSGVALGGAGAGNGDVTGEVYTLDRTAPAAALLPPQPVVKDAASYSFTVAYSDGVAVAGASLGNGDVRVTGPGGFNQLGTLVSATPAGDGARIEATYSIPAPGGAWNLEDNGTYAIVLEAAQVEDTAGNAAAQIALGSFDVGLGSRVYLPIVARPAPAVLPDLVVERIGVRDGKIELVIANVGRTAVTAPFWVDAYVGPRRAPRAVNETWQVVGDRGMVWGVTSAALPLAPGARMTLTVGDAFFRADLSRLPLGAVPGTPLYAQVDSANTATAYGAVLEDHERDGGAYNNIAAGQAPEAGLLPLPAGASLTGAGADPAPRPAR